MAELHIHVPGEPERTVGLVPGRAVTVGRGEDCTVQIAEKRASRLHCRIETAPAGTPGAGWLVADLGSSNGTFVGSERVLRRALADGDQVRIGETTLTVRGAGVAGPAPGGTPPPAVFLSGALAPVAAAPVAVAPPAAPAPVADEDDDLEVAAPTAESVRAALAGRRAIARSAIFLVVAVAVFAAVQFFLGGVADKRASARAEVEAFEAVLKERDRPYELLQGMLAEFVRDFPRSRHRGDLERIVEARRLEHERLVTAETDLDAIQRNAIGRSEEEVLARLKALALRVGEGSPLDTRLRYAIDAASRRRDEALGRALAEASADADRALSRGDVAGALRRVAAFEASRTVLPQAVLDGAAAKRAAIGVEAGKLAEAALSRAAKAADPDARRAELIAALRGFGDLPEGNGLRSALVAVAGGAPPPSPTPGTPAVPGAVPAPSGPSIAPSAALLAQAAEAEGLAQRRAWAEAAALYRKLAAADAAPRAKAEWAARLEDLERLAALPQGLAEAVAAVGDRRLKAKLSAGTFEVLAADPAGAKLKRGDAETTFAWAQATPADLLAVLGAGKPVPDRTLGLAVLAADLGDRAAAVGYLVTLVDVPTHKDSAFRVMARRLEGRAGVPEGGYVVLEGDLVDRTELARRTDAKAVASLEAEAVDLVKKVAADPLFRGVERLRGRRDELDRRRAYALLAIFNEKHWPYPHDDPQVARQYEVVTTEVDRRWHLVQEVWDEPLAVKMPPGTALEKLVARHAEVMKALDAKGRDTASLRGAMAPLALHVGVGTLTIRSFARDEAERDLLAYNRWVMDNYNPSANAVATEPEREQVRVTNEYRVMMGWAMRVEPGATPYADVTRENVAKVLDEAREAGRVPLHAVRIDDRLVSSARAHSMDMERRGYFAHTAPPNPATGTPATSPFDRMAKAGYRGGGMSENIAMANSPLEAHQRWLRSSGHHRNIVSDWADLGVGLGGRRWTQNFGVGGGAPWFVPGRTKPEDGEITPGSGPSDGQSPTGE